MKKVLFLSLMIFTTNSFASGIGNVSSAPCDNATLDKYTGTANVEINWEPNTIGLKWFNGEEQVSGQNSCVYDGTITVPPQPTKPGYTFNGWKIPKMDFTTIPKDVSGTERWSIGLYGNSNRCHYYSGTGDVQTVNCNSDSTFNELEPYKWKVHFTHGDLYGTGGCSETSGDWGQRGTPTIDSGPYCWCKVTAYKPNGSNVVNMPLSAMSWVRQSLYNSADICPRSCDVDCAYSAGTLLYFRTGLFTPAQ